MIPLRRADSEGFILLAVLWVTALLSMFALNYATSARLSGLSVGLSRDLAEDRQLLRSALEKGRHEYLKYKANRGLLEDKELVEWITGAPLDLMYPRYEPYRAQVDGRDFEIRVIGESGRLNVNTLPPELMERILVACGLAPGQRMTEVVNSILDWIDPDDLHRPEGAESDYYLSLSPPYPAKNHPLQSIEELLLIKGIDPDLYHGGEGRPGLVDFLGVSGQNAKLDVNSASPRSFSLIEGFPEEAVQEIVRIRQDKPVTSLDQLVDIVPQRYFDEFVTYFGVVESPAVRLQAALVREDGTQGATAELLVRE